MKGTDTMTETLFHTHQCPDCRIQSAAPDCAELEGVICPWATNCPGRDRICMPAPEFGRVRYDIYPEGRGIPGQINEVIHRDDDITWVIQSEGPWRRYFKAGSMSSYCEGDAAYDVYPDEWTVETIDAEGRDTYHHSVNRKEAAKQGTTKGRD